MDHRAGAARQLLGHISAFQTGDDVEAGLPDNAGDLLDGHIRVSAQIGDVAAVVFVGEDEANGMARAPQGRTHPPHARLEVLAGSHILAIEGWTVFQDAGDPLQVPGVIDGWHYNTSLASVIQFGMIGAHSAGHAG